MTDKTFEDGYKKGLEENKENNTKLRYLTTYVYRGIVEVRE